MDERKVFTLLDGGDETHAATAANVRKVLGTLRSSVNADDVLLVMLIGHGSFDGVEAKFNLVGPDLSSADWAGLLADAEERIAQKPAIQGAQQQPQVGAAFSRLLDRADQERAQLEDDYVSTEHLFLALDAVPRDEALAWIKKVRGNQRVSSQDPEGSYQALEKFGRDLTEAAENGKLDPVIGRDEEIRRVIQVLSRRTKNNPVLIGEPGVG